MSGKQHRKAAKQRVGAKSQIAPPPNAPKRKPTPTRRKVRNRHLMPRLRKTGKRFWWALGAIATVIGIYLGIGELRSQWTASRPPAADIVFFEKAEDEYRLVDPMKVVLNPSGREVERNQFAVPINLAVRNQESARLEATRIEIYYPKDVEVRPAGKPRIDPQNRVLIYEHDLEDLQPINNYTPLETVDILYFPFSVNYSTAIFVNPDMSFFEVMAGARRTRFPNGLNLDVKVFARGRPPLNGRIRLLVGLDAGDPSPSAGYKKRAPSKEESRLFQDVLRAARGAPNKWVARDLAKSHLLMYRKIRHRGGTFGLVLIDHKVREVSADIDSNGYLDLKIIDTTAPSSPNSVMTPLEPEYMVDIPKPPGKGPIKIIAEP